MKFIGQQADLLEALNIVQRAAAARSTIPTLECVWMRAEHGTLTLMCTDLQMGIESSIPVSVEREGQVLLPVRLFSEIVRKLPEGEISFDCNDHLSTVIRMGHSRTTLQGLSTDEFPAMPIIEGANTILLSQNTLRDMIRQTSFAVATEETRPILKGCYVEVEGKDIRMVALDGFRVAIRKATLPQEAEALKAVVPGRYMNELARLLEDEEGEVALGFGQTHLMVDLGAARMTIRLLEGEYINYKQLLPSDYQTNILVPCAAFAECVDRASLMARQGKTNLIRLHIENDSIQITSNSEMGDIFEEMPVEMQGPPLDIAFNVRYVNDLIKNLSEENILMRFNSPVSPCLVLPVEGDAFIYLLLPVRIYGA